MARKTSLARSAAGLARYYMDCGWWRHRHFRGLPLDAIGLYSCIVGACNEQASDGRMPADPEDLAAAVGLRASAVKRPLKALIDAGRVTIDDADLVVVGFGDHNPTTAEIEAYTEDRSRQGTLGNHTRWHVGKSRTDPDCEYCNSSPPARSSDRSSDPPSDRFSDPQRIANSSHGMGWDGMGTTQVVSPTGRDGGPDQSDDDDSMIESRQALADREAAIGPVADRAAWLATDARRRTAAADTFAAIATGQPAPRPRPAPADQTRPRLTPITDLDLEPDRPCDPDDARHHARQALAALRSTPDA